MASQWWQTDLYLKVTSALNGQELSVWVPGDACVREIKAAVRENLQRVIPFWHMELLEGDTVCKDEGEISDYDFGNGFALVLKSPETKDYTAFYGPDLHIRGHTAAIGPHFRFASDVRKQDIMETLVHDERVLATVG